ncbi:hypothetical protein J4558_00130 [Leptolyngbya sp. 15MV]|nr:hypothetical protein J4558_00130 [Leptolyngbya sp. 15MV]
MNQDTPFLRPKECADLLGVSVSYFYLHRDRLMAMGMPSPVAIGGTKYPRAAFERWLAAMAGEPVSVAALDVTADEMQRRFAEARAAREPRRLAAAERRQAEHKAGGK